MADQAPFLDHHQGTAPDPMRLRRRDPSLNMDRYYYIAVQRDLFGGASVIREWGRVGRAGQVCCTYFTDEAKAVTALTEVAAAKVKRGYLLPCGLTNPASAKASASRSRKLSSPNTVKNRSVVT